MNVSKLLNKLKYYQVLCFDKDGNILKDTAEFVVPIFTSFTNKIPRQFVDEKYISNYLNYIKFSKLFSLTLEGAKEVEPIVIAYLSKNDQYVFTLARYGDFEYAELVARGQKQSIIYDMQTRTMLFIRDTFNELWAKVDEDIMISSYGRMKVGGVLVKQDRRRYDVAREGRRWKPLVRQVVFDCYMKKSGPCKTKHEPLDFYYRNIVREVED